VFRESDWAAYRAINQRFADAVVAEARSEDPVVLVQDYHFALLPAMIREKLPQATILTFWHIPWPNPESFGICPWRREILQGMLGSTILGFHTRYHCKNFIETVDRYLEARIEHEHSTIAFQEKETLVESYPISIEWPGSAEVAAWATVAANAASAWSNVWACPPTSAWQWAWTASTTPRASSSGSTRWSGCSRSGRRGSAASSSCRWPHRRAARWTNTAASRSASNASRSRINERFGRDGYQPVHLLAQHHEHDAVMELFRAADICVVTSLHDGMNLVCKEFVAARDDLQGVLILSRFAGRRARTAEALIVNPYHVEETADALHQAATMPAAEQRERMASLRSTVREFNVFRWAGRMLADAGRWRLRARIEARVRSHQSR
jgi:trehalose-6-phosphate synthase